VQGSTYTTALKQQIDTVINAAHELTAEEVRMMEEQSERNC
jgi:hypothetical protein